MTERLPTAFPVGRFLCVCVSGLREVHAHSMGKPRETRSGRASALFLSSGLWYA